MTDIAKKFKKLDEITHIRHRPGMYIGSTQPENRWFLTWVEESSKLEWREIEYVPGALKLIDEIISNSVDEHRRKTSNLNRIHVMIKSDGEVTVWDNGGIPVEVHPEHNMYVPELIFGHLRTGSNYDDTEDRNVVGTNGVGSTLTNIFSTIFEVKTGDGSKSFYKKWSDGMQLHEDAVIMNSNSKFKGTKVTFKLDLAALNLTEFTPLFKKVIEKRCIDAAASNPELEVVFEDSDTNYVKSYQFKTFRSYVELFGYDPKILIGEKNKDWEFFVVPTEKPLRVGFVNGAECNEGTHFGHIEYWCHRIMEDHFMKVHKWKELPKKEVLSRMSIFVNIDVKNPSYSSQTKEKLITRVDKFYPDGHHPDMGHLKFIRPYLASDIPAMILDWATQKTQADENKKLRLANRDIAKKVKIAKLIEANSKDRSKCELWLFEGGSASSGFRQARNPDTQAAYSMRGKVLNTLYLKPTQILNNEEFKSIVGAIGLQFGDPKNTRNLRYDKVIICTDMDVDGTSIAGLLITFFTTHFKGLVEEGRLYRAMSPIIIATKGKDIKHYYSMDDFHKEEAVLVKGGYFIRYIKGLGGLESIDYKKMLASPKLERFTLDDLAEEKIHDWFGRDSWRRKQYLEARDGAEIEQIETDEA